MPRYLLLLMLACLLTACSQGTGRGPLWEPTTYKLDMTSTPSTTQSVTMEIGDYLVLEIRDPGDGGYTVDSPVFDKNLLKLSGFRHVPPARQAVFGDFGRFIYSFEALTPGATDVRFTISRPWENTPSQKAPYHQIHVVISQ